MESAPKRLSHGCNRIQSHHRSLQRIAVFRALKLGDMLCAVPALRGLRSVFPRAEITLIGLPWAHEFAARFPGYIDRFLPFPGFPGLPEQGVSARALARFLRTVQARHYALAVQMHGSGEISNGIVSLFGARETAGFHVPGARVQAPVRALPYPEQGTEVQRLLALARFLGADNLCDTLEFPVTEQDEQSRRRLVAGTQLDAGYVCVHAGCASAAAWPTNAFATVADAVAARGWRVVLTGTPGERARAQAVAETMRFPCIDVVGKTDLGTLAALLAHARLLVSNDTGVVHLAQAVGAPTVVIFTNADVARWAPRDRRRHRVLEGATVERTLESVSELLGQERDNADAA